jgi:hypothetical protein
MIGELIEDDDITTRQVIGFILIFYTASMRMRKDKTFVLRDEHILPEWITYTNVLHPTEPANYTEVLTVLLNTMKGASCNGGN